MTSEELLEKLNLIQKSKCETQTLELKAAEGGCPKRLYDTLSSFSNQTDGGIIIFGVDEKNDFKECGVYDPQDIQKKIGEQCLQMEPVVRPLLTVAEKAGKYFVSAEIPGIDISSRPCYYKGSGRLKGSYVRVGDSDALMTEYEIYCFEAFRKKYQDDIRTVPRASFAVLDEMLLGQYMDKLKSQKKNISSLPDETIRELMSITRNGEITLSSLFVFCKFPQVFFPQLCIIAVALPGEELGDVGSLGERFSDNMRIEGSIPEMLDQAIVFVKKNVKTKTIIDPNTGQRADQTEYPIIAIREAILNALVHRDYSVHTEGKPIQIIIYPDRIEIKNPGGLYGRMQIDELGIIQPDTRNPVLVTALETMNITENRYSGIPTIRRALKEARLKEPVFSDVRGTFIVTMYNTILSDAKRTAEHSTLTDTEYALIDFLETPKSRQEIAQYLKLGTVSYAMQTYINPLIEKGLVQMTIPESPKSPKQRFVRKVRLQ